MRNKSTSILAVCPSSKQIGVALLSDHELLYYGVKTVRNRRSMRQLLGEVQKITLQLIARYEPQHLAIKRARLIQKSAALAAVVAEEIKSTATQKRLQIHEYQPTVVREMICKSEKATKSDITQAVITRFVELGRYTDRASTWEQLYYFRMIEAVAVGLCCQRELPEHTQDI